MSPIVPARQLQPTGRLGTTLAVPALFTATGEPGLTRFIEFFTAHIRNPHTRRAY